MGVLSRFIDRKIRQFREIAAGFLDGLDDRRQLLAIELGRETRWLVTVAILALAALIVVIITTVWVLATVVALCWDTPWRMHVLIGSAVLWLLLSLGLLLRIRALLRSHPQAFPLSRQVLADDMQNLRGELDREHSPRA